MEYIRKNQNYFIAGLILIIIIGFTFWGRDEEGPVEEGRDETTEETSSSPASTGNTFNSTNSASPRPTAPVGTSPSQSVGTPSQPQAPSLSIPPKLDGTFFRMASYNGAPLAASDRYILSFDNGYLSVNFCNSMSGLYVYDGKTLTANNLVGTKKFCSTPSNIMDIETTFITMLNFGALMYESGDTITLVRSGVGTMTFTKF